MTECGCRSGDAQTAAQRRTLLIALTLNAAMFILGTAAGIAGQSSALIADALDMLADASAYAIALVAVERDSPFKAKAATLSGTLLMILGIGVILDAGRRAVFGSMPAGIIMIAVAIVSLSVNTTVLHLLRKLRSKEVHLRATYIFTRADVIANIAVILSGIAVLVTGMRYLDLAAGAAIGIYVVREALEILGEAREAQEK